MSEPVLDYVLAVNDADERHFLRRTHIANPEPGNPHETWQRVELAQATTWMDPTGIIDHDRETAALVLLADVEVHAVRRPNGAFTLDGATLERITP